MEAKIIEAYNKALRAGQKYYKDAVSRGVYPYPPALDQILDSSTVAGYVDLGLVDIPTERITGTKTPGRSPALAGNFMPLMGTNTEFSAKWMSLCAYQLGDEGIRDPVKCYEYMGRFYVEEGNKRVSVLKSLEAPAVPGTVTRVVPRYSNDPERQLYYEFMRFYSLSGLYGVDFHHPGEYARLQAALGFDPDHVWTPEERRSFSAGFTVFRGVFEKLNKSSVNVTPAEALLIWLQMFPFDLIKELPLGELEKKLLAIWPDIALHTAPDPIALSTEPESEESGSFLERLLGIGRTEHLRIAFIYGFRPDENFWTGEHNRGRLYIQERMGERVSVKNYLAINGGYAAALEQAVAEGAEVIFATLSDMIVECRRAAAIHPGVKILVCALSQPYTGVRFYFSRIYEAKFVAGAVAGAMTKAPEVGYVASHPIVGVPAEVNAFALGLRMTNPDTKVRLAWSCLPSDPMDALRARGIRIVSNWLGAHNDERFSYRGGTWIMGKHGLTPLTNISWNWGKLYEQMILTIFSGAWDSIDNGRAINYWWGMDSGVIELSMAESLPEGVRFMGELLKKDLIHHAFSPFRTRITDRNGVLRNDGSNDFTPEELMSMDWFCNNVIGDIPRYDALLPEARKPVRLLGLYREKLPLE